MLPIKDNNPTSITPWVTYGIIAVNVAVFLLTIGLGPRQEFQANLQFGAIPAVLFGHAQLPPQLAVFPPGFEFLSIFTAMFMHGGWAHIGGNMLYLWIFGNNVEDAMGHVRFLVFYLICGVAAALGHGLTDTASQIPMIGASGALAGVLGAYFLLFPKARVLVWFFWVLIFYVPAVVVLGFWIGMQFLSLGSAAAQGVAIAAHIAGFFAGCALIPFFKYRHVPLWQGGPTRQPVFGMYRPGQYRRHAANNANGTGFGDGFGPRSGNATRNAAGNTTRNDFGTANGAGADMGYPGNLPPWAAAYEAERAARREKFRRARGMASGPWGKRGETPGNGDNADGQTRKSPWGDYTPSHPASTAVPKVRRPHENDDGHNT